MKRQAVSVPRISDAEWLIMRVLWAKSPATAKDVVAALEKETSWSPKTVLTLINRLVEKGALAFEKKEARTHRYYPKVLERDCVRIESRSFLDRVYGGAVQPMLAHFVEETNLTEHDITELRRILDEKEPAGRPAGRPAGACARKGETVIPVQPGPLGAFTSRLLEMSWQASLLICAVLLIRFLVGRRMSAQWRHALWLLVILRLVLPWTPASRFSIYSIIPNPVQIAPAQGTTFAAPVADVAVPDRAAPTGQERFSLITALWLIGAAGFASWLLLDALSTVLALRGRRPVTDKAILDLLEDCKEELAIRTYLAVVETPHARAPALFGWIRPRLLLPPGVLETLSRERLRHVFLHELAHLKRHDIALNWLMALVQVLHWFNPLVWLAFQRARIDMELACDELALARLEDHESSDYGHTILDLLQTWVEPKRLPMFAAIGEDVTQVKRRIQMVAAFKKGQHTSHLLAAAVVLFVGVVFMVDARDSTAPVSLGIPDAVASVSAPTPDSVAPPIDSAMKSATAWLALLDSGDCGQAWPESHSVVKGMISRETFGGLCTELLRAVRTEYGALVSRRIVQVEYVPNLPIRLGDGVSVSFRSKYEKGEFSGPKILLAKDTDGAWRMVRSDKE